MAFALFRDVFQAAKRAKEAKNGVHIAYSIPRKAPNLCSTCWLSADARHPKEALRYIQLPAGARGVDCQGQRFGWAMHNANPAASGSMPRYWRTNLRCTRPRRLSDQNLYFHHSPSGDHARDDPPWSKVKSNR